MRSRRKTGSFAGKLRPGDAGLLTLRGLQVLQDADVVFYDHLVSDGVRELIRRERQVELCFENLRYFDTRTWMTAETVRATLERMRR